MNGVRVWHAALARALTDRPARPLALPDHGRAAVLVPVLDAPGGPSLLFTVRAANLARHAGQIAFPGGRLEPGERDVDAALRETREEVGLAVGLDQVVGRLDDVPSPFGLVVTPFVAIVPWPVPLTLDGAEATEAFTVELARLRRTVPSVERRVTPWGERLLHAYEVDERRIWGLTGNVVKDLLERLHRVEVAA